MTLVLLAAVAIGAISIGSASAMPANNLSGAGGTPLQDVRLVCDNFGRCYNTRRGYRSRAYYSQRYYDDGYYDRPRYGYYGGGPGVGIGIGPFGFRTW